MSKRNKILSTRKLPSKLTQVANNHGVKIDDFDFIEIKYNHSKAMHKKVRELIELRLHVIFTSKNAVKAVLPFIAKSLAWQVYCVGEKTARYLENKTSLKASITCNSAADLADAVRGLEVTEYYYFCGDKRRDELPVKLKKFGILLHEIEVYETRLNPVRIEEEKYDGFLFFSPTGAKSFFHKNNISAGQVCFAIGKTTATALENFTDEKIITIDIPGKEKLVKAAVEFFAA